MACTLTLSLISESQEGTVGDDWKYELEAKVYSGALTGEGTVSVAKHTLASGDTQPPPGPPEPLVIAAGECGDEIQIHLRLKASEVDLFRNDVGENSVSFSMRNPNAGGGPIVEQKTITVGVTEMPAQTSSAEFQLTVELKLSESA